MTQIEWTGGWGGGGGGEGGGGEEITYHVLNDCNVKIVMMEHLWCDFVVVLIQKRLLLNIHIKATLVL